ncbi:hypothetical protein GCM10009534_51190 [Kribbella sandramycini]
MISNTSTMSISPSTAHAQNIACQFQYSTTSVAAGTPNAAPTPSVELINAIAGNTRRGGNSSRKMPIPNGTTATAAP